MSSFKEFLQEQLLDEEFAEQYEQIDAEMDFAVALALRRKELGLTQHALAMSTGIKQPMIARIEGGQMPTAPTLQKLAKALQVAIMFTADGAVLMPYAGRARSAASTESKPMSEKYRKDRDIQYSYKSNTSSHYKLGKEEEYVS